MSDIPLIFIDVETIGTRTTRDRITEIAALKVVDGHILECWSSLINPRCRVPSHISQLTGIYDKQVLGLEKGNGRCFAHQLGKCKGACCGKEPLERSYKTIPRSDGKTSGRYMAVAWAHSDSRKTPEFQ